VGSSILRRAALRWLCAVLLVGTVLPAVAVARVTPTAVAQAQTSIACDGATTADYNGPCGPSFILPRWTAGSGWDQPQSYETILLADFDGDQADELLGRSASGFVIYKWNTEYGQWMDMGPQAFPGWNFSDAAGWNQPQFYETIQAPELSYNDGIAASLLMKAADGIVAFQWDGNRSWTQLEPGPKWGVSWDEPKYYTTIQAWGEWLLGRGPNGIEVWTFNFSSWVDVTPDTQILTDANGWDQPQYYETIKLTDLDGDGGPELAARGPEGMLVFDWDSSEWTGGESSGILSDVKGGDQPRVYETITYGDIDRDPADELLVRLDDGVFGFDWNGIGSSPEWTDLTFNSRPLAGDEQIWNEPRYYSSIELVEWGPILTARGPDGMLGYEWNSSTGDWSELFSGPALADGGNSDAAWAQPDQYRTIQYGNVNPNEGLIVLIARGQYGIRTWTYDGFSASGWVRPGPYGFQPYNDSGRQAAFELVNAYLNLKDGATVRGVYASLNTEVGRNYASCLDHSVTPNQPQPPTETCYLLGPPGALANPNNVTAEQWGAMVKTLQSEIAMAEAVNGYFNESLVRILQDIFAGDDNAIHNIANELAIEEQAQSENAIASWYELFVALGRAILLIVNPELETVAAISEAVVATFTTIAEVNEPGDGSEFQGTVAEIQAQLTANNAAAIDRNNEFFQYVVQDFSLLYAVGTLVDDQTWLITADLQNDMVSVGRRHYATWVYQTLLPTIWLIQQEQCSQGDDCPADDNLAAWDVGSTGGDGTDRWVRYVYNKQPWTRLEANDPALVKMFSAAQSGCYIGDGQGIWEYSRCNLGLDRAAFFGSQDGWSLCPNCRDPGTAPHIVVEATAPHSAADDGGEPAPVNPGSSDVFHAAVLSSPSFDARTIDPTTVTLASAPVIGWWTGNSDRNPDGTAYWPETALSDVNNDGLFDVMLNFHQAEMQLQAGDTEAYLEGETVSGQIFGAVIPVTVIGAQ